MNTSERQKENENETDKEPATGSKTVDTFTDYGLHNRAFDGIHFAGEGMFHCLDH